MKTKTIGSLIAVILVLAVFGVSSVSAQVTNGDFETGNFNGWTKYVPYGGSADVVNLHAAYNPVNGNYFAKLKTDGPGSYTTLTQDVYMSAGTTIEGWAAFDAGDYFNDNADVRIFDSSTNLVATPWYSDVSIVGKYGNGPWTYWEWTAPAGDTYTLELRVSNAKDSTYDSYALFDYIILTDTEIPEFSTIALPVASILGLLFFFNYRKRRRE